MSKHDDGKNESMLQKGLSRRGFLQGSILSAVGVASGGLLAGCGTEKTTQQASKPQTSAADWLGEPPNIADSEIKQTLQADVVIVGAGIAGLHTARAASEAGASVIVVEKAATYQFRSGQYGSIDNKIQKAKGIKIDKAAAVLESMKQMGYRADARMWKYWADHSGADFDWMLEVAPVYTVLDEENYACDKTKINIHIEHYPQPKGFNVKDEFSPTYPTVLSFFPSQGNLLKLIYQRCLDKGVKFVFSSPARKLIRLNNQGRVEGVICQDANGAYMKVLAKKAVVLCTGDYGNNKAMMEHFVPWSTDYVCIYPNKDSKGNPLNVGDGHKMGAWAGGQIESVPHAPVIHTLGGPLGTDAFFLANLEGKRFCNEDVTGQQLSLALYNQPGNTGWYIWDDKWPDQIGLMNVSHGAVNYCVPDDKLPKIDSETIWTVGKSPYVSREGLKVSKDLSGKTDIVMANTLTELVGKLGIDEKAQKTLLESIKRYNELCNKGVDEDFYKTSKRLFPIETGPFYAGRVDAGVMLVVMGGFACNPENCNVLDKDNKGIEGLYAVGNTQGGRFAGDYPVVAPGVSHGFALTFGRLVGNVVAKL